MNAFDLGDTVKLSATFRDAASALADPTAVTLQVRKPDDTVTTSTYAAGEITRDSLGVFHKNVVPDASGVWYYRFIATGAVVTEEEGAFFARLSAFA